MTTGYDRPTADEYPQYYGSYISKVPPGDLIATMTGQIAEVMTLLRPVPEAKGNSAYAPGKWTIKQVLGHVIDAERVFSYRAMSFARADSNPLPSFDENAWIGPAGFADRSLSSLIDEFVAVRSATVALFSGLPVAARTRKGIASGKEITVRALAHIIPGHLTHHLQILKDRYLA